MRIWFLCLVVVTLHLQRVPSSAAAEAVERRVVILEAPGSVLSRSAREHVNKEIADIATRKGLTVAPAKSIPDHLLRCELPGCLPPIAAASGATFVIRVDAKFAKESFKLGVELWDTEQGKMLGSDRRDCAICDEQDLWGSAALIAERLLAQTVRALPIAPPPVASQPASAVPVEPEPSAPVLPQASPQPSRANATYTGIAMSLVGLGTMAFGVYYLAVDGNSACVHCDRVRDTGKFGWPLLLSGGVVFAGGVGLLSWSLWPRSDTRISFGPAGVEVAGRFQ